MTQELRRFIPPLIVRAVLFAEDEVVYYDDVNALLNHINYYQHHDQARKTVAEAGWRRAHNSYNEKNRTIYCRSSQRR